MCHFPSQHWLALEDTVTTMIIEITLDRSLARCLVVSRGSHVRRLSRWSGTSSLGAIMYVVSWGDQVRRLSGRSRTSSLEAIRYVVSQGDQVRCLSCRTRTWNVVKGCMVLCALYVRNVLLMISAWRTFCLLPLRLDARVSLVRYWCTCVYTYTHVDVHVYTQVQVRVQVWRCIKCS